MSLDRKSSQHGSPVAIEGTGSVTIQATRNSVRLGNSVATYLSMTEGVPVRHPFP